MNAEKKLDAEQLLSEVIAQDKKLDQLENQLTDLFWKFQETEEERANLQQECYRLQSENSELLSAVSDAESKSSEAQSMISEAEKTISELLKENSRLQELMRNAVTTISRLSSLNEELWVSLEEKTDGIGEVLAESERGIVEEIQGRQNWVREALRILAAE